MSKKLLLKSGSAGVSLLMELRCVMWRSSNARMHRLAYLARLGMSKYYLVEAFTFADLGQEDATSDVVLAADPDVKY